MCETCGCGDPHVVSVEIRERILSVNDRDATHNREQFTSRGVMAINMMGSPGSGKTAVLEATARAFAGRFRVAAIAGDLETERDAERLRLAGIPARAITTGSACHLDAAMVHHALHHDEFLRPQPGLAREVERREIRGGQPRREFEFASHPGGVGPDLRPELRVAERRERRDIQRRRLDV